MVSWFSVKDHFTPEVESPDHYISSDFVGGKGGASPSSLHTGLERLTEYANARWV